MSAYGAFERKCWRGETPSRSTWKCEAPDQAPSSAATCTRLVHTAVLRRFAVSTLILAHRQHPRNRSRTHPKPARTHDHHVGTVWLRTQCHTRRSRSPQSSLPMPHSPLPLPSVLFAPQHAHSASLFYAGPKTPRGHRPRWPRSTHSAFSLFRVPTLFLTDRSFFLLAAHCVAHHACLHTRTLARACTIAGFFVIFFVPDFFSGTA